MSTQPEPLPPVDAPANDPAGSPSTTPLAPENPLEPSSELSGEPQEAAQQAVTTLVPPPPAADILDQSLFTSYAQPYPFAPREERIPHLGHLGILAVLVILGWFGAGILVLLALHAHLWGISNLSQASTDFHYSLASQAAQYLLTFAACLLLFPVVWRRSFFDGIHWRGAFALQRLGRLVAAAVLCFFVAMINGMLMPGPTNAPIDQLFRAPGAAWVLFAFGVTLAPFFEEMAFRGFLLPSLCTAFDWSASQLSSAPNPGFDASDRPKWNSRASLLATLIVSIPFLSLCPCPEGHYVERILFVLLWGAAMALWWFRSSIPPQKPLDPHLLDQDKHPRWSISAMAVSALLTSIPFAMMHGVQTGWSLGPFLLLIFVSIVLCWVRLSTRSLAASTIVHACYNFMLFSFMLLGTGGFKHLDKM